MASAWAQAGELARVNQYLRQCQLGCAVAWSLHIRHLARMAPDAGLQVLAPAAARLARVPGASGPSAWPSALRDTGLPRLGARRAAAAAGAAARRDQPTRGRTVADPGGARARSSCVDRAAAAAPSARSSSDRAPAGHASTPWPRASRRRAAGHRVSRGDRDGRRQRAAAAGFAAGADAPSSASRPDDSIGPTVPAHARHRRRAAARPARRSSASGRRSTRAARTARAA